MIWGNGYEITEYLEVFLRNLLLNGKNELHNRSLHISGLWNEEKVDIEEVKVDIETEKVDIISIGSLRDLALMEYSAGVQLWNCLN